MGIGKNGGKIGLCWVNVPFGWKGIDCMNSGRKIRKLRRDKDLTQGELAALVGVSATTVCEWERGSYAPCPRNAEKLSIILESDELLALLAGRKTPPEAARKLEGFNAIVSGLVEAKDYTRRMSEHMSQPMKQALLSLAFSIVDELADS